ncbi:Lipase [Apiospora phragmitis]|uniref:Lipase n=1 Tax=Apiospora phragmitis TaxID=2905665 RepID=A0ABR1TRC3_9PEZI
MRSCNIIAAALASLGLADAATIAPRGYNFPDSSCSQDQRNTIHEEIVNALNLASFAATGLTAGPYFNTFFPRSQRDGGDAFVTKVQSVFANMGSQLNRAQSAYVLSITCDDSTKMCQNGAYVAHMKDKTSRMNFCDRFFATTGPIKPTQTRLREGGRFDRSGVPYANPRHIYYPDPNDGTKEGICKPELATNNADTYTFIAAGVGYSRLCNREIPLPSPPASSAMGAFDCNSGDDAHPFDDGADDDSELGS